MKIWNKREIAENWLLQYLADHAGTAYASDALAAALAIGITKPTLINARQSLALDVSRKGFGKGGRWYWKLNEQRLSERQSVSGTRIPSDNCGND